MESLPESASHADTGRKPGFLAAMIVVIAIRACVLGMGIASVQLTPEGFQPQFNVEHPWMAWDAHHYHEIAKNGYSADRVGVPFLDGTTFHNVAYFPVVPLVGRLLSQVMPLSLGMVLFSNVCSLVGFIFLFLLARDLVGTRTAIISMLLAATFPGAVSFAAGMTEGPFFMLVSISLWLAVHKRFYPAAVLAGIATATRPTGIALSMVVVLCAWFAMSNLDIKKRLLHVLAIGVISVSGLAAYESFLWHRYGSARTYFEAQQHWGDLDKERISSQATQEKRNSWEFIRARMFSPVAWNRGIAWLTLAVGIAGLICPGKIPRLLFLLPVIIFVMTYLPGNGLRVTSIPRYQAAVVPLFLIGAVWFSRRRLEPMLALILIAQFVLQMHYAYLFTREMWVG